MIAREMPSAEILASMQHVEQRALDLRDAGVPGTLEELKARAYLDLLQERDSRSAQATQDPSQPAAAGGAPDGNAGPDDNAGPGGQSQPAQGRGPSIAALVNIVFPASALDGDDGPPGEVAGFGLIDHHDIRDLAAAAARHPATRWCVTVVNPDGTAAAHGCAAGPRPWPLGRDPDAGPGPPLHLKPRELMDGLKIKLNRVIRGPCNHAEAQSRYRPGRTLQHLVKVRNATCTAPGCGGRPPAATWTTPTPGTGAAGLVRVTSPLSAVTTTGVSRPKDGGWNSRNPAS